jgi:hypothetical protein
MKQLNQVEVHIWLLLYLLWFIFSELFVRIRSVDNNN